MGRAFLDSPRRLRGSPRCGCGERTRQWFQREPVRGARAEIPTTPMISLRLVRSRSLVLAAAALLGTCTAAFGFLPPTAAVSNLNQTSGGSTGNIGTQGGGETVRRAFAFTTGDSADSFDFTGASFEFNSSSGAPNALTISLYASFNANTAAGGADLLSALTLSTGDPHFAGVATYSGSATLAANTTYYLVLSAGANAAGNYYTIPSAASYQEDAGGLANWSITNGQWISLPTATSFWEFDGTQPYFSVQATAAAVPEPSTYAIFAGVAALGFVAWRRRRNGEGAAASGVSRPTNPRLLCAVLAVLCGGVWTSARADERPVEATITALKGSATLRSPGGRSQAAVVGAKIPVGTVVSTAADTQLTLQPHDGIAVVIGGGTEVEMERLDVNGNGLRSALLALRGGSLAASLDPTRKASNNFGVRTKHGIAMARGTTLTVSVRDEVYTVSVLAGEVSVRWGDGAMVSIAGQTPSDITTFLDGKSGTETIGSALAAQTPGLQAALVAAAAAVATVANSPAQVTTVLAAIANASGGDQAAATTIAEATAAAVNAGMANTSLVAAAGDATAVATKLTSSAVNAATAAGNSAAAEQIVRTVVATVASSTPATDVNALAVALTEASNAVAENPPLEASAIVSSVAGATPGSAAAISVIVTTPTSILDVTTRSGSS